MEILSKINWVDILIVIIMLRTTYVSFKEGFSHSLFPLIAVSVVGILSLHYYPKLSYIISQNIIKIPAPISDFLSFLALVVISGLAIKFIKIVLDKIIKVEWHPVIEKFGGLIVGALRASVVTSLVLIIMVMLPLPYIQWSVRDRSVSGIYFLRVVPSLYSKTAAFLPVLKMGEAPVNSDEVVKKLMSDKAVSPDAKEGKKGAGGD